MLESRAIIIERNEKEGLAIVEPVQKNDCGYCNGGNGCGSSKLSQLFCVRPRHFRVRNSIGARVGEEVQVSIADGILLRSAVLLYGLPILMLFLGAVIGSYSAGAEANQDMGAAVGAGLGLVAGFLAAKYLAIAVFSDGPMITRLEK